MNEQRQGIQTPITYHYYSWIGPPVETHEKLVPEKSKRTTTIPGPPLESSRRGKSKSALTFL